MLFLVLPLQSLEPKLNEFQDFMKNRLLALLKFPTKLANSCFAKICHMYSSLFKSFDLCSHALFASYVFACGVGYSVTQFSCILRLIHTNIMDITA